MDLKNAPIFSALQLFPPDLILKTHPKKFAKNIENAECKHIATYLSENIKNNTRHFFKFFKSCRQDTTNISALKHNNTVVTTSEHKAQVLNNRFQSVFTQERNHIPDMPDSPYQSISPFIITTEGIQNLLETLGTTKATGPDNIPAFLLKIVHLP